MQYFLISLCPRVFGIMRFSSDFFVACFNIKRLCSLNKKRSIRQLSIHLPLGVSFPWCEFLAVGKHSDFSQQWGSQIRQKTPLKNIP